MQPTPYKPMSLLMKIVFWFVAINALAGAGSLMLFPNQTDGLFFWKISPALSAGMFGALYLGGAIVVSLVTSRGQWEPSRYLVPILVSAGVLISLTTFLHLDRFTPGFKLFYWLLVYIVAPILALVFYIQHERGGAVWEVVSQPIAPLTRRVAITLGALLLVLGAVCLIWPNLVIEVWPWTISPLMVRIFTSWFSAFGFGLLWFWRERDWSRVAHIPTLMIAAAGLDLLMVFIHRADLNSTGLNFWLFCFHLAAFGLIGGLMHWWQYQAGQISRPASG
ncbi:MAG: hypothetical protein HS114_18460 [Anaerolineales bacterium]|nr:hypothetical protein [Anaerolineales bacterium]